MYFVKRKKLNDDYEDYEELDIPENEVENENQNYSNYGNQLSHPLIQKTFAQRHTLLDISNRLHSGNHNETNETIDSNTKNKKRKAFVSHSSFIPQKLLVPYFR